MKPSQIRAELLKDHDDLRARMRVLRVIGERCLAGEDAHEELRRLLGRLTAAVRNHNAREEQLMANVFPELDAWGPIRREIMSEEHVLEHEQLVRALTGTEAESDSRVAARLLLVLFDQMLAHMEREEKVFLGLDVLSDEVLPPDAFGG